MDYVEVFSSLKTNNKYSRKSPHKAVLLLTIIQLYESCTLTDNIIKYDDTLKSAFRDTWNKVLPNEATFQSEAYLPFWYMQSESFWHIVPLRGKEDILTVLRDNHIKPSERKLIDCVNYAELDEDLYFLMTLQSGRTSLKRVLLENYTTLSKRMIEKLAVSEDNFSDHSETAMNEYENILNKSADEEVTIGQDVDKEVEKRFYTLSEDLQYALNIEYYTFLKGHYNEREMFKDICPTVYDLYDHITQNPLRQEDIAYSLMFTYENFLSDLKISLMSEDGSFDLVDSINNALNVLHGVPSVEEVAEPAAESKVIDDYTSPRRLAMSVEVEPVVTSSANSDYYAENSENGCAILNHFGEIVYSTDGQIKKLNGTFYRFNWKYQCFTAKAIVQFGEAWGKTKKLLVAFPDSPLYQQVDRRRFIDEIEDFIEGGTMSDNRIKYLGVWYDGNGDLVEGDVATSQRIAETEKRDDAPKTKPSPASAPFLPAGKIKYICDYISTSYDYLCMMAIIDLLREADSESRLTYDELACMMIANAWEMAHYIPEVREHENRLMECVQFLLDNAEKEVGETLSWEMPKHQVYNIIKEFPMYDIFEDVADEIMAEAPYSILKTWYGDDPQFIVVEKSQAYENNNIFAIFPRKYDPHIVIKPGWKKYFSQKNAELLHYFADKYLTFIDASEDAHAALEEFLPSFTPLESEEASDRHPSSSPSTTTANTDMEGASQLQFTPISRATMRARKKADEAETRKKAEAAERMDRWGTAEEFTVITDELIDAALTPRGGITRSQLEAVGLSWPKPLDWREQILGMKLTPEELRQFMTIKYAKP